jgi:hypothetical protein
MTGGEFKTQGGGVATVDGQFDMDGGNLSLAFDQTSLNGMSGTLNVTDQVTINGGHLWMKAHNPQQGSTNDSLYSAVGVNIGNAAALHVSTYGTPPAGAYYDVIVAASRDFGGNGITGDFGTYDIPNLDAVFGFLDPFEVLRLTPA